MCCVCVCVFKINIGKTLLISRAVSYMTYLHLYPALVPRNSKSFLYMLLLILATSCEIVIPFMGKET